MIGHFDAIDFLTVLQGRFLEDHIPCFRQGDDCIQCYYFE
jgi:hypothetical protein